ncbi:MAG: hypothetical protein ACXVCE_01040 [Bacteriovorax sp.]
MEFVDLFIILTVGVFFFWLANIFIEGPGLGYALNLLISTIGAIAGLILYKNTSLPLHSFWGAFSASTVGALIFLTPLIVYATKREAL